MPRSIRGSQASKHKRTSCAGRSPVFRLTWRSNRRCAAENLTETFFTERTCNAMRYAAQGLF